MKQSNQSTRKTKTLSKPLIRFEIISAFPEVFPAYFSSSILGRAQRQKKIKITIHHLRDFALDKRRTIDDKPFGGGPGMILKVEPIARAVNFILTRSKLTSKQTAGSRFQTRIILLSAKGKLFTQKEARRLAKYKQLILICGHYEGVDERVAQCLADEELSIGEYVLTGGELPAMVIVDAVSRLLPGVLGKAESLKTESYSQPGYLEYPQYTRPEVFYPFASNPRKKRIAWRVPKVLLSGNHQEIERWRQKHSRQL